MNTSKSLCLQNMFMCWERTLASLYAELAFKELSGLPYTVVGRNRQLQSRYYGRQSMQAKEIKVCIFLLVGLFQKICIFLSVMIFCPPPFRRKAEGHSFWLSVLPSVLPSPYRSMYLVCATPPTVLFRFFWNFTDVFIMLWKCACGLDIILRLIFDTFFAIWT